MSRLRITRRRRWGLAALFSGMVAFAMAGSTLLNNGLSTIAAWITIEEWRKKEEPESRAGAPPAATPTAPARVVAQREPAAGTGTPAPETRPPKAPSGEGEADDDTVSSARFEVAYLLFPVASLYTGATGSGIGASSMAAAYVAKPIVETEVFRYVIDKNADATDGCEGTPGCGEPAYPTLQVVSLTWHGSEAATDVRLSLKGEGSLGSEPAGDEVIEIGDLRPGESRLVPIGYGPRMKKFDVDMEQVQRVYKPAAVSYKLAGDAEESVPIREEREHPTWIGPDLSVGEVQNPPDAAIPGTVVEAS